jgi:hypothetical protein
VYDLAARCTLKTIQVLSSIIKMTVDSVESFVYLACENLNVYQYPLGLHSFAVPAGLETKKRATLSHKKRICSMCLTLDGRFLITGDAAGLLYIWMVMGETTSKD